MPDIHSLLRQPKWRFVDHSNTGLEFSPIESFAYDDMFCTSVGIGESAPVIRAWVHSPTIVLGIQDARLPFIEEGVQFLTQKGYQSIVRNSGGLAVVLDEGIVNVSLIWPEGNGIDINRGYEAMWQLIQLLLERYSVEVEAGEIVGSYCPGSFDLSIFGKKFAGISQRRLRGGVAVQIYVCVNGSGSERAEIVRGFYELALRNEKTKFTYPTIVPATMASLEELLLLEEELTPKQVVKHLLDVLTNIGSTVTSSSLLSNLEEEWFQYHYERMIARNK